ncbi:MAG: 1-phosphofructokinase family hexose kinase [Pseudolabrys sp.]
MAEIVTLTINPAVDIFVNVGRVEPTHKLRCSPPKRDPGGGGINVARVAHRLGGDVMAIYPTGGQIGKLLQRLVERENIASLVTPSHVETRENFTAYEEPTGEQYRFVLPGSALHRAEWEAVLERLASLPKRPKFVVASGSVPPGVPIDFFARVARHAKALGAKAVIDTSGDALKAVLEEGVSVLKPNLIELSEILEMPLDHDEDRIAACRKLTLDGCAEMVALTLGENGAMLVTADRAWRAAPLAIDPVSTVGAGDSFLGGLVAALAGGKPLAEAFRVAIAAASAAVLMPGTGLCQPGEVERLLPMVKVEEVVRALV